MLTLRDLKAAASSYGTVPEDDSAGRWTVYQIPAPYGKVWAEGDCKHICVEWMPGDHEGKQSAISDAIERMRFGTREMTTEERYGASEE